MFAGMLVGLVLAVPTNRFAEEFGSPLAARIAQFAIVAIAIAPLLAWLWWKRRYVRRIAWLPDTQTVILERFGHTTCHLPLSAFDKADAQDGQTNLPGAPIVNAPYRRLLINGLPPLILDDQGTVPDRRALDAILAGRPPNPPNPRQH